MVEPIGFGDCPPVFEEKDDTMVIKYHPCGYPLLVPKTTSVPEEPFELFDGHRPEVLLTHCPGCGEALKESDLQDHWDDLEFELH